MAAGTSKTEYRIVARIVAKYDPAGAETAAGKGAKKVKKQIDETLSGKFFKSVSDRLAGLFTAGAVLYGVSRLVGGIGSVTAAVIGLNSELQDSKAGLASLFSVNFSMPIDKSMRLAESVSKSLRRDAARGVGEFQDYLDTYQMLLTPAVQAGARLPDVERLTRLTIAAGAASGRPGGMKLAGLDVLQAMQGSASARTMQVLGPLMMASGLDFKKFNALSGPKKLEALTKALEKLAPGADLMGRGWSAQADTFKSLIKQFVVAGSSGIFNRWLGNLRLLNDWLLNNQGRIEKFVGSAGAALLGIWDAGMAVVGGLKPLLPGLIEQTRAWGKDLRELSTSLEALRDPYIVAFMRGGIDFMLAPFRMMYAQLKTLTDLVSVFAVTLKYAADLTAAGLQAMLQALSAGPTGGTIAAVLFARQAGAMRSDYLQRVGRIAGFDYGEGRFARQNRGQAGEANLRNRRDVPMGGNTYITGPVSIKVDTEVNADPTRVAAAFDEAAWKLLRNPRTAKRPAFAGT